MEASSHSHTCAGLVPSGKPLSQRVARHALAILHLLTTEDDTGASGDIGSFLSVDLVIPGKKRILQRIQKLVLGIIHLLTEGTPQFDDVAVGMSDEDWINVEREQRELYRDLMTENELTLHSIASNNVKTETASRMDRAEPRMERSEPRVESQQSTVERDRPPGGVLGTFSTPLPCTSGVGPLGTGDTTCFEDYEASFIDATKNDHPDTYKNNSKQLPLSTHHETTYRPTPSDSCVESYHKGFPESLLSTYPSTLPDTCQNALLSNISDTYQNTLPDKLPVIQIKQEGSQMELNSWHWTVEAGTKTRSLPAERPMEILAKKQSTSPKISSHCRNSTLVKDNSRKLSGLVVAAAVSESRETEPKSKKQNEQLKRHAGKSEIRPPSRKPQWKKPFECLRCEKSFNCRSHLVMHQRVHTRERPYVCSDCGKSFTQSSNLFRHQRGHRGERPHVCTYCGKTFTHSSYLLIHQRTHTGEKPYSCSDCGKCFRVNSTLVRHQRVHMVGNIAPAPKPNHFT